MPLCGKYSFDVNHLLNVLYTQLVYIYIHCSLYKLLIYSMLYIYIYIYNVTTYLLFLTYFITSIYIYIA